MPLLALLLGCRIATSEADPPPPGPPPCPTVGPVEVIATVPEPIAEASGIAASRRHPGVLWLHNDSGDTPRLFALGPDSEVRAEILLTGASARDWEDMAATRDAAGEAWLWVGDIGDNRAVREQIVVHRLREPDLDTGEVVAVSLTLTYPDGPRDAEALLVDPRTSDLYVVSKSFDGVSRVYRLPDAAAASGSATLEAVAELRFGTGDLVGGRPVTAGDVSPDGAWVLLRTYTSAHAWWRGPNEPLHAAFERAPCRLEVVVEPQGEAIAFTADGSSYLTASEFAGTAVTRYPLR